MSENGLCLLTYQGLHDVLHALDELTVDFNGQFTKDLLVL